MKYHKYRITAAHRPTFERTAATARDALRIASEVLADTPRVHYRKSADHAAQILPILPGKRGGLSLPKP
jgi:hypothetical protein